MRNQQDNNDPSDDTEGKPVGQRPVTPSTPEKGAVREEGNANPNNKEDVSNELAREFRWVERAQIGSNVVLAVVGIIALCIYYGQLSEMRKSSTAAQDAANAAKNAANTAAQGLDFARQQFRMDQRPYLSPEARGGTSLPGGKTGVIVITKNAIGASVAIDIRNIGKSPAIETFDTPTEYKIGPRDDVRREVQNYIPNYTNATVGSMVMMNAAVTPQSGVRALSTEELRKIQDGTWEFYVVGGVSYRDIFSPRMTQPYETTYCYQFVARGIPFHNCSFSPPAFGNAIK
jgi:hypothetical protein